MGLGIGVALQETSEELFAQTFEHIIDEQIVAFEMKTEELLIYSIRTVN